MSALSWTTWPSPVTSRDFQPENQLQDPSCCQFSSLWFIPEDLPLPPRRGPSHSRRQPSGHIPRPRNPFIMFRSHILDQDVLPKNLDFCRDNRQVSRIVSHVWTALPGSAKDIFYALAEQEKRLHKVRYPDFKLVIGRSKAKRSLSEKSTEDDSNFTSEVVICKKIAQLVVQNIRGHELQVRAERIIAAVTGTTLTARTNESNGTQDKVGFNGNATLQKNIRKLRKVTSSSAKPRLSYCIKHTAKATLIGQKYSRRIIPRAVSVVSRKNSELETLFSNVSSVLDSSCMSSSSAALSPSGDQLKEESLLGGDSPDVASHPLLHDQAGSEDGLGLLGSQILNWDSRLLGYQTSFGEDEPFEPLQFEWADKTDEESYYDALRQTALVSSAFSLSVSNSSEQDLYPAQTWLGYAESNSLLMQTKE